MRNKKPGKNRVFCCACFYIDALLTLPLFDIFIEQHRELCYCEKLFCHTFNLSGDNKNVQFTHKKVYRQ